MGVLRNAADADADQLPGHLLTHTRHLREGAHVPLPAEAGEPWVEQGQRDLTAQLNAARAGNQAAAAAALAQVYAELKQLARGVLRGSGQTLNPTALVHEAFLKLIPDAQQSFADRAHFFRLAARAMRQILIDQVRAHSAEKRGGQWVRTDLSERLAATAVDRIDLLAVDAALDRLQAFDPALAELVEAYFFAGFTFEEIAGLTQSSERSVRRQWEVARLFLMRELRDAASDA